MKRIFMSLLLLLAVGLTTVLANGKTEVNGKIKKSFNKEFAGAASVKWDEVEDYQMATFIFYGYRVIAFFNEDGDLLGSARDIFFEQLPLAVINSINKRFAGADIIDIHEVSNIEGTTYGITVETLNERCHIKANANGTFLAVIKTKVAH